MERKITTDRVNSSCRQVSIGDFNLILPGSSEITIGKGIKIRRLRPKHDGRSVDIGIVLYNAIKKIGRINAAMVSGGIDSSVMAALAKRINSGIKLIVCGFSDSEDVHFATILGDDIDADLMKVIITDKDVLKTVKELKKFDLDAYSLILGVVEYQSLKKAKEAGLKRIINGMGSDELFFGFRKHKLVSLDELKKYQEERLSYVNFIDILRIKKISEKLGVDVFMPYLEDDVIASALSLNIMDRLDTLYDKSLLRQIGSQLSLSKLLVERKKKAMQYGSGVVRSLERMAKKEKIKNVGDFIKTI